MAKTKRVVLMATLGMAAVSMFAAPTAATAAEGDDGMPAAEAATRDTAFDDTYMAMAHNTYDRAGSFTTPLDLGLRSLEADVISKGDWESDADGPYVSHSSDAGEKNCSGEGTTRLGDCLRDVAGWLDAHPGSGPVQLFVDLKGFTYWEDWLPWEPDQVNKLDEKIEAILGDRMYTTDDLYRDAAGKAYVPGEGPTLREAVAAKGWPSLGTLDGKVIVTYTAGANLIHNQTQSDALQWVEANKDRLPYGFMCPDVEGGGQDELAPGAWLDGMTYDAAQKVVCVNVKATSHYELIANESAKFNQLMHLWGSAGIDNTEYAYSYLGAAHGVTAIGRDGTDAQISDTFGGKLPLVGVRRSAPGFFELRAPGANLCADGLGGGTGNGTAIGSWDCNGGDNQRFVYTAEGQLRPKNAPTQCIDLKNGKAGDGVPVHTWDCDGGASEKWTPTPDGALVSRDNGAYCLTRPAKTGAQFTTSRCDGSAAQRFDLTGVPDWTRTQF
jgi:hypothetical protein